MSLVTPDQQRRLRSSIPWFTTPDQTRRSGPAPFPPFATPRPESRRLDLRWPDGGVPGRRDRDKEVNVQVVLRCRPLSDDEQRLNVQKVIICNEQKREVTVSSKQIDKTFTFDKVFGINAQQRTIYDSAILPVVSEVLEGFNCTVFAYGQTGTGKTYTMEGGTKSKGELATDAGVIPRAVRQIFDTLEAQKADYSVKVSFLELYNEEITDLLAPDEGTRFGEERQRRTISLMEDGKGGVFVRGLEEEVVYSASDIYSLLERGSAKRRTADTLLNKQSSRSHSIFSITVHVREATIGGEELIKCGKLNLVDLAGSENILRSGAREGRAREAGEINKSLLTLGRVITALVEHSGHIPYRDSKLTRLLRESLGGKTKTCIIATVSPSAHCLEETLSTLDYAYRAKNIRNKPEVNQKLSKSVLLKDLYLEIERMKQDVRAAREKNGVYIPHERFVQNEAEKKVCSTSGLMFLELVVLPSVLLNITRSFIQMMNERVESLENELEQWKKNLENVNRAFQELQENHRMIKSVLKEKEFIISKLLCSGKQATKNLESRIGKIKDSYSSGVAIMKDFACSLQQKASQNLEHMETTFYAQALTIENFLVTAVSEAEYVLHDIQGSLSEHKQLVSFSAKQQEEGLQRNLVSTLVISKTTIDFFNDFHSRASRLMKILEENHIERSCQIASFEMKFKVDSVSEALKNMSDVNIEDKRKLEQEMFSIQKVSEDAKKEWNSYIRKVESQIQEDTFTMAGARGTMEHILQDVYQPTCTTPKKRDIIVPSLASIEGSKAPPFDEIVTIMRSENRSNERIPEGKAVRELPPDELSGTPRSPLTEVN
ncbi:putative 125 kDa kinesin-related protein [Acorus gramineus]|uniref:Kinesin-like protein n=1 Tax=Acorus gramineus TaxID=55184 RepID=A0AAV9B591_ACOGR|nr:putative 125 kDa kinesin-related protein [Acorus gramineus]